MNVTQERLIRNWIGPAILGGSGLLGGVIDSISNAVQGKKNREAQALENEKNRQWQERMWQEHESPQAQAQNMREAGLNPMGQVSSQSVGSASTSALPTPPPSTLGSSIARAGELVANSLQARRAHILEQDKFYHQQLIDWREQFRKELDSAKTREDYDSIIAQRRESIKKSKSDRRFQDMLNDELEEARKEGYNRFKNEQQASEDTHALSVAQTEFSKAQTQYQNLQAQIASEQNEQQKKVLEAQAKSLMASATQSYANALLANAQTEVAKSSKIKIDSETEIGKNKASQEAALHELQIIEQNLINQGLKADNVRKELENARNRILSGDIRNFGELGQFIYTHLHSMIPFASTPLKFE